MLQHPGSLLPRKVERLISPQKSIINLINRIINEIEKYTTRSLVQEIDHNTPFNLFKIAPVINGSEVIVGSNAEIIYQLKDQFDNNIDDRKRPITSNETIKFLIDNKPNATFSGTWMGTSYNARNVTLPINQTGFIVVNLITDSNPGLNTVHVVPQSTIPDSSFDIRGVAKGEPYTIHAVGVPESEDNPPHY